MLTAGVLCLPVLLGLAAGRLLLARLAQPALERALSVLALVACASLVVVAADSWSPLEWACWYVIAAACGIELGALRGVLASRA